MVPHFRGLSPQNTADLASTDHNPEGFQSELFPLQSPLLRESWLVSFPPLSNMLKFSGYSCLIGGPKQMNVVDRHKRKRLAKRRSRRTWQCPAQPRDQRCDTKNSLSATTSRRGSLPALAPQGDKPEGARSVWFQASRRRPNERTTGLACLASRAQLLAKAAGRRRPHKAPPKKNQRGGGEKQTLQQTCFRGSASCVQRFDDSLSFAIRMTYRISLRSSSLWEPRHPSLKVLIVRFIDCPTHTVTKTSVRVNVQ